VNCGRRPAFIRMCLQPPHADLRRAALFYVTVRDRSVIHGDPTHGHRYSWAEKRRRVGFLRPAGTSDSQASLHERRITARKPPRPKFKDLLFRRGAPCFCAFDALMIGDKDLRRERLIDRKQKLRKNTRVRAAHFSAQVCQSCRWLWHFFISARLRYRH
jgi:hypothetical protein